MRSDVVGQNVWLLHLKLNKNEGIKILKSVKADLVQGVCILLHYSQAPSGTFSYWCAAATSQGGTMASHKGQQDLARRTLRLGGTERVPWPISKPGVNTLDTIRHH